MLICGLDTETTGLLGPDTRIVELGYALYDTETKQIYDCYNTLLWDETYPDCESEAEAVHGLTKEVLGKYGKFPIEELARLENVLFGCDYICAHNGPNFDMPLLRQEFKRYELDFSERICIDTQMDIDFPKDVTQRRLKYMAVDHGFLNPFPHRALFDVVCMFRILSLYDIERVVENAKSPTVKVRAMVNFDKKELAKERRYQWDADKKIWTKQLKEFRLAEEKEQAPFEVVVLKENTDEKNND